jgi:type II secretory pathway pseudopilin PulG
MAMTSLSVSKHDLRDQAGFSFVGIMLIVLAMGLFTSALFLAIPPSDSARNSQITLQRAANLEQALKKYKRENSNTAPVHLSDLLTTTGVACTVDTNPASSTYKNRKGWCGPYLDQPIASDVNGYQTDGWGVLFTYDGVNLKSCGPDRTCGNGDDLTFHDF